MKEASGDELWIPGRQRQFLALLARGFDVESITRKTSYTASYVYAQLREARSALGARTNESAIVEALRWGVISMPEQEEMRREDSGQGSVASGQ